MNRLVARLILSHLLVVLVGAAVTYLVVRQLAPALFDESLRMGARMGMGQNGVDPEASGLLRQQVGDAVNQSLVIGLLAGVLLAAGLGTLASARLLRPIVAIRQAARRLATGHYDAAVPVPEERELAELATDVNTLAGALASTEQRRVRLLGEVAHEMRTPLTVIHANIEGMIDGVVPAAPAQLSSLQVEVRRLTRLVDDLSTLSRATEGAEPLHRGPLDLREVVQLAAERLRPQAADAGLELVVETSEVPLTVDGDADRLAQVVTNLVGNAIRASHVGGRVSVRSRVEGHDALVEVQDSGVGIGAEDLERVFERFVRLDPAGSPGSGIGLTIARAWVEAHGGTLSAASAGRGAGATFTVRLPLPPGG
ncbi:HAMP domain-containing sensor histidine kinase [Terrabacter sp. LjRoot27]|uniref:sensor histidine kinase n=1 Tax=Terrabacter sp. LjRoot27 TaxID=3342306 RepID=UPI003ECE71C3